MEVQRIDRVDGGWRVETSQGPVDTGHVVVATYERIRSRRGKRYFADMAKALPIVYAVAGIMVFLGVLALVRDIIDPLSLGG